MALNNPKTIGDKFIQIVAISDVDGNVITPAKSTDSGAMNVNIASVNGKVSGSFFGDNFVTTNRIPTYAAKWSQGLPVHEFDLTIENGAKWEVVPDAVTSGLFDGSCRFKLSGLNKSKIFATTKKKNRYLPGHLSYFGYTITWNGVDSANGDFVMLVGAINRGPSGSSGDIRDGMVLGIVRESGVTKKVVRFYKNFTIYYEKILSECTINCETLNIFEHQVGYYGIHPSVLWYFNKDLRQHELLSYDKVESVLTTVSDPNLSWGVYLKNDGNTAALEMYCGSMEFGNYTNRPELFDASARILVDEINIASIAVDSNDTDGSGFLAAYKVPETVSMISEVSVSNVYSNFNNTISNQLLSIQGVGTASRPITLNIYMLDESDVTATFTALKQGVNVLQRALSATVNHANRQLAMQFTLISTSGLPVDVKNFGLLLMPKKVAVFTLTSALSTTATNVNVLLQTQDLF